MEQRADLPIAQFIAVFLFLLMLLGCGALWRRIVANKAGGKTVWPLALVAGAVPVLSLALFELAPERALNINVLSLLWLLAMLTSFASLLARVPRRVTALCAGVSTGCILAFMGAFVGAMLD